MSRKHQKRKRRGLPDGVNWHHAHPRSRCRLIQSFSDPRNLLGKDRRVHSAYHRLFTNMIPLEVLYHLMYEWAGPKIIFHHVHFITQFEGMRYYFLMGQDISLPTMYDGKPRQNMEDFRFIFGEHATVFDAMIQVIDSWSPQYRDYWRKIRIEATVYTYDRRKKRGRKK